MEIVVLWYPLGHILVATRCDCTLVAYPHSYNLFSFFQCLTHYISCWANPGLLLCLFTTFSILHTDLCDFNHLAAKRKHKVRHIVYILRSVSSIFRRHIMYNFFTWHFLEQYATREQQPHIFTLPPSFPHLAHFFTDVSSWEDMIILERVLYCLDIR